MLENTASQDFSIEHAICFEKQLQTTPADLYGGENSNMIVNYVINIGLLRKGCLQ